MKILPAIVIVFMLLMAFVTNGVIAQTPTPEPTVLGPGDVAIIGFNFDNPDEFAFVLLKDINPNTKIMFTDCGWSNITHSFFNGQTAVEAHIEWKTTTFRSKGEIIPMLPEDIPSEFNLDIAGDQIFAYQGNLSTPIIIFGINSHGGSWAENDTLLTKNNSHLPASLNSTNSIALSHIDNAIYNGGRSFTTPSDALAEIVKPSNWTKDDLTPLTMPSGSFSLTPTNIDLYKFSEAKSVNPMIISGLSLLIIFLFGMKVYFKKY